MDQLYSALHALWPLVSGVVVLSLADLITGVGAAVRSKTFDVNSLAQFISTHLLGRVLPILALSVLGTQSTALAAVAAIAIGMYTAETLTSIRSNLGLPSAS